MTPSKPAPARGHTPGKWIVDPHTDWRGLPSNSPENRSEMDAECRANARLIAAAPELLAFVENVEDYLVCMGYDPETADPESTGVQHVLTARALLASVRGGA